MSRYCGHPECPSQSLNCLLLPPPFSVPPFCFYAFLRSSLCRAPVSIVKLYREAIASLLLSTWNSIFSIGLTHSVVPTWHLVLHECPMSLLLCLYPKASADADSTGMPSWVDNRRLCFSLGPSPTTTRCYSCCNTEHPVCFWSWLPQ